MSSADTTALLLRVLHAARTRTFADTLAIWLPLPLLAAGLAWRWTGPAAGLGVLGIGLVLLCAFAWWRVRPLDRHWLVGRLDRRRDMEDSSDLLFADQTRLNPLQRLQRARLQQRLASAPPPDLRAPWSLPRIAATWLAALLAAAAIGLWPVAQSAPPVLAPSDERVPAVPGVPRLVAQHLRITPPAYTGLPPREETRLDAKAPQGSRLLWTLRFDPQPDAAELALHDGRRIALTRNGDTWSASLVLDKSLLYRVLPQGGATRPPPRLHRLDAIADKPPQIKVLAPDRGLSLLAPGQQRWPLSFQASDDHGVASRAQLRVTLAQGSGENISFREQHFEVAGKGDAASKRFDITLDLAALGFAVGDDLIAQLSVNDNRSPQPQTARSPSLILRWPPDLGEESTGLDGMVKKVLPAYFRSQRQIILDAEALQKEKRRLDAEQFLKRADEIGVDQRILRLRYGQFLGEEAEGGPKPPPTNDAGDDHDQDGHDNDDHAAAGDGHDHGQPAANADGEGFGRAADVLAEYGHTHDHAEAATLLDPETRATLKLALDQMWQSELHLRQGHPDQALPFAYKALGYIKQVQQASRIYLARVGPELPPIDESRRLSGDRAGLARRELAVPAALVADPAPAAVWRALQEAPGDRSAANEAELLALERWLHDNESRVPDPLSLVAAIDALRSEPDCSDCRQRLRALLWQTLARPPAQVRRRAAGDAAGARYLDGLREESGQ